MQITGTGLTKFRPQNNRVIIIRSETQSIFSSELNKQEERFLDIDKLELEDIKEALQDVGDDFEREPTLANFRVFRELIGKFAKKATSIAYRIEKKAIYRSSRALEIVAIIDRAADELYHLVMEGQQNRVRIAGRIANINGMIIQISV
ncbi:MAG TPA: YaaR family protein [Geobacteraceae bacterium]|nr:YaaR family protein [Geobacteraceae bacterium]